MKIDPFDQNRFIGYTSKVTAEFTQVHFPNSKLLKKFYYDGDVLHGGVVRNFVIIEGEGYGFLAKIISIELPEKERSFLSESAFQNTELHPTGRVEIQLTFENFGEIEAKKGLEQYPPVGAKVYVCSPELLQFFLKDFGKTDDCEDLLEIARLPQDAGYPISISANAIFSRHCAIVGTTGGGKSYTIAKLIEELLKKEGVKMIVLDATGEFDKWSENLEIGKNCHFHYKNFSDEDLIGFFRPAGQVQLPVLREAVKSLRTVELIKTLKPEEKPTDIKIERGNLKKTNEPKASLLNFQYLNASTVEDPTYFFDIARLATQVTNECVYDSDKNVPSNFGAISPADKDRCASLVLRISSLLNNAQANTFFNFKQNLADDNKCIISLLKDFLANDKKLLRVNLESMPKETDITAITVNAIGKYLLKVALTGMFRERPIIVFLDEAHLFLNKKIKDEYSIETELNAFDRISKECRKYGLFLCLSTQRPRDIPQGVLSQMGTFFVHRLINQFDREAVENASPEGSRYVMSFLPSLGKGEAILMGVDFPMPINLKIKEVKVGNEPNSHTPKLFQKTERASI